MQILLIFRYKIQETLFYVGFEQQLTLACNLFSDKIPNKNFNSVNTRKMRVQAMRSYQI